MKTCKMIYSLKLIVLQGHDVFMVSQFALSRLHNKNSIIYIFTHVDVLSL